MLLATDLDGTFLGGDEQHKQILYQFIENTPGVKLVFVTGRGLDSVKTLIEQKMVPQPQYIICDVGGTIVDGKSFLPIEPLQSEITVQWPGFDKISPLIQDLPLEYQPVQQQNRSSFYCADESFVESVKERLAHLNCDVIFSAGKYLDILPSNVNKGTSLTKLITHLDAKPESVLVAGDTFNDYSMYAHGYKGVVVGNAEPSLVSATQHMQHVHFANIAGAGGILEAIWEFPHFSSRFDRPQDWVEIIYN